MSSPARRKIKKVRKSYRMREDLALFIENLDKEKGWSEPIALEYAIEQLRDNTEALARDVA